jgi:hypothetical protein
MSKYILEGELPTYHDLYVTTPDIERTSIGDLSYDLNVSCARGGGWALFTWTERGYKTVVGEYEGKDKWLILDVAGVVICNSRDDDEKQE